MCKWVYYVNLEIYSIYVEHVCSACTNIYIFLTSTPYRLYHQFALNIEYNKKLQVQPQPAITITSLHVIPTFKSQGLYLLFLLIIRRTSLTKASATAWNKGTSTLSNSFPLLGVPFGVVAKSIVLVGQVAWVYLLASHVIPERDRHQFQCLTFVIFIGSDLSAHSHHHAGSM